MSISPSSVDSPLAAKWQVQRPASPQQWADYHALRWQVLRKPWGQPPDSDNRANEQNSEHLILIDQENRILACGRLQFGEAGIAQVRSMAVVPDQRNQGLGLHILRGLERLAQGRGIETIRIHARRDASNFYTRAGYSQTGVGEMLFGQIPHLWMEKTLDCHNFSNFRLKRRAAVNADGPAVSKLIFGVLAQYGLAPEHDGIDQDLSDLEGHYAGGFFDLLLDEQDELIATVAVLRLGTQQGELRRMYLAPEAKSQGLGRALLGHALAWCRQAGIRELELETASVLKEALSLYRWAKFENMPGDCAARRCDQRLWLKDF